MIAKQVGFHDMFVFERVIARVFVSVCACDIARVCVCVFARMCVVVRVRGRVPDYIISEVNNT